MKYPQWWRKIVNFMALISGALTFMIAALAIFEIVMRYILNNPTSWSLNTSQYLLIWLFFMGAAYAFQERGHVAVDMFLHLADRIDKSGKRIVRRVIVIMGLIIAIVYIGLLMYGTTLLLEKALKYGQMSDMMPNIPIWILYLPMIIGMGMMVITAIFMILDTCTDSEKYL